MFHCNSCSSCLTDDVCHLSTPNTSFLQGQEEETQQQTKNVVVGTNWDVCDYDIPLNKRKIEKEKKDKDQYGKEKSQLHNVSSSTSHDDTKIANKQETKKTCNVDDEWEIKKVLEKSDVCRTLSRLMLKKELTQEFVIPVVLGGAKAAKHKGVEVKVWDVDTKSLHSLVFKIWTSAQSYVFNKRWFKDFVLRRELKKGDQIGLHWDQDNGRFNFSVIAL
ncbi:unnamed protein product [Trifolium pratense]|uniref:Uncharacterized protein n=1 Tax=Trifolium pratense TaxID=57577 RepID=A0ACB0IZ42_TRIPR|nr:unnamed protein product [Trifolium pratense]